MRPSAILVTSIVAALGLSACDRRSTADSSPTPMPMAPVAKTDTLETARLDGAIDAFEREPTSSHDADVKKAFADLDGEIAELQQRAAKTDGADREEAAVKLKNMQTYRMEQGFRYTKAQATSGMSTPSADGRSAGDKLENGAKKVGNSIEKAGEKVGDTIKDLAN